MDNKQLREEQRDKLVDVLSGQHVCDDEGHGCKTEEFYRDYGHGAKKGYRCKLQREAQDQILALIASEKTESLLEGVEIGAQEMFSAVDEVVAPLEFMGKKIVERTQQVLEYTAPTKEKPATWPIEPDSDKRIMP
jgi:hypothetical protein